ncbi:hypothetical protein KKB43_04380 [Patescibacteria group bacterium]|nr:hypothetical protein [Patescibacteria group bacterium]MBU4580226.1 hypothetical protein [Patescibacteria group bacterium]
MTEDIRKVIAAKTKDAAHKIRENWILENPKMKELANIILIGSLAAVIAIKTNDEPLCVVNTATSLPIKIAKREFENIQVYCKNQGLSLEKSERIIISMFACAITDITSHETQNYLVRSLIQ